LIICFDKEFERFSLSILRFYLMNYYELILFVVVVVVVDDDDADD
jgi:hypothetical protein